MRLTYKKKFLLATCWGILCALPGWSQNPAPDTANVAHTIFLLGHSRAEFPVNTKLLRLQTHLKTAGKSSTAIFIGNPFYPRLLPGAGSPQRATAENALKAQLDALKNYAGQLLIVPGDHQTKKDPSHSGRQARAQEQFIQNYLQNDAVFAPSSGCPGPAEIEISPDLTLLLLDTKWLLPSSPPVNEDLECNSTKASEALAGIDDILKNNHQKQIVVAAHLPLGIKPYEYRYMHRAFTQIYRQHGGLIHAEDNSPALSYVWQDSINYIRTGLDPLARKHHRKTRPVFSQDEMGFAKLIFYKNGEAWLEFWSEATGVPANKPTYRRLLMKKATLAQVNAQIKPTPALNFSDSVVTVNASNLYKVSKFKRLLLGENYRREWQTPVTLPVFDVGTAKGGLKVLQRGGGFQTRSLRLADKNGKEFVLRSVEKYPIEAIPRPLRKTVAADIVKDQISASHPYAPLVIPPLAKAAGIFYTNPKYFFVPNDPRLGNFRTGLSNTIALFEERPDDDESKAPQFGNSKKVYSTAKVFEKLQEDNDDEVDQQAVVRARLFDLFIGDWDRHEDQWRWASFEKESGKGKIYQPIPRDRDMTFFINQGIIPKIASRKWILPKIQGFDEDLRDVTTFNFNARYLDRSFLTELSLAEWQAVATDLQKRLTDEIITTALKQLPEPVFKIRGPQIIKMLRARRARLLQDATDYYTFLARMVEVVGSDKTERFEVFRQNDDQTQVTAYKISKDNDVKQILYQRVFNLKETREVRLYGLAGDDVFIVSGRVNKGIIIRIIGGEGQDQITDSSYVKKGAKKTYIYDTATGNQLQLANEVKNRTSDQNPNINDYDRKAFQYNFLGPVASIEYNKDDGFYLGGGFEARIQGFRKNPFAASHRFVANYALATESFLFNYAGYFTQALGIFDVATNLDVKTKNFADNFFGLSNRSVYNREFDIDFYRYRSQRYHFNVLLGRRWGKYQHFLFGPAYQWVLAQPDPNRNLGRFTPAELSPNDPFARKAYLGTLVSYIVDSRDDRTLPSRGVYLQTTATA